MAVIKDSNIVLSSDIGNVLNAAGGSVNINQPATFFTSAAKINHAAKYKPVILPLNFVDKDSKPTMYGYWWKANDGKCGYTIPSASKYIESQDKDSTWTYNLPTGGESAPMRLGDFRGYDTNAAKQWINISFNNKIVIGEGFSYGVNAVRPNESSLSYYDVVDELWLTFKAMSSTDSGHDYKIPMDEVQSSAGTIIADVSASEIAQWGAVSGTTVRVHLWAKKNGVVVSAKNDAATTTFWTIPVVSSAPYTIMMSVMSLRQDASNKSLLYISVVTLNVNAVGFAGGTIESGSRLILYKYVSDNYNYLSYATPLWTNTFEKIEVAAGASWSRTLASPQETVRLQSYDTLGTCILIWYDKNNNVLSQITQEVTLW